MVFYSYKMQQFCIKISKNVLCTLLSCVLTLSQMFPTTFRPREIHKFSRNNGHLSPVATSGLGKSANESEVTMNNTSKLSWVTPVRISSAMVVVLWRINHQKSKYLWQDHLCLFAGNSQINVVLYINRTQQECVSVSLNSGKLSLFSTHQRLWIKYISPPTPVGSQQHDGSTNSGGFLSRLLLQSGW